MSEIALGKREGFLAPQSGAPHDHDQSAKAPARAPSPADHGEPR
jgi:hypothetical protein